ncbi:hypothetical protein QFZ91_004366 [Paraburkholderia sp. JPY419]
MISTRRHCRSCGSGSDFPVAFARALRGGEEVGPLARVEPLRTFDARLQQLLTTRLERTVQGRDEFQRFAGEDRFKAGLDVAGDFHALRQRQRISHVFSLVGQIAKLRRLKMGDSSRQRAGRHTRGLARLRPPLP